MSQKKEPKRYKENPFRGELYFPTKNKQIKISRLGEDNNIIINQDTGEYLGGTSVVTFKTVDATRFVKVFTENIKLAFDLTQAGQKVLYVLFWAVQRQIMKDRVEMSQFTLSSFLEQNQDLKMSLPTYWRGLRELVNAQILAMTERKGDYFINPNFVFNGDRVAFTTVLEREKQQARANKQKNNNSITQAEMREIAEQPDPELQALAAELEESEPTEEL